MYETFRFIASLVLSLRIIIYILSFIYVKASEDNTILYDPSTDQSSLRRCLVHVIEEE